MKLNKIAEAGYRKFSNAEGCDYIAGEFAMKTVLNLIDTFNVIDVLELGLGIGSMSDTVLNYGNEVGKNINYTGTEANAFCLTQLPLNLTENYKKIKLLKDASQINLNSKFDLIIIDGSDDSLLSIQNFTKKTHYFVC